MTGHIYPHSFENMIWAEKVKILNEQREVIESLHKIPVDIINENPHQLVSDWDMLAFLNVITRWWNCQIFFEINFQLMNFGMSHIIWATEILYVFTVIYFVFCFGFESSWTYIDWDL